MTAMKIAEAAAHLEVPEEEVDRVDSSPAGHVIVTRDGVSYVLVDEKHPDAEGKYGLMYLSAPTDPYAGAFPVYAGDVDDSAALLNRELPDNSGKPAAGPSAATAAQPAKVDAGDATTAPDPTVDTDKLDPGLHDPAVGGPVDAPPATPPLSGDGPVDTTVISDVPAGTVAQVLTWVGDNRGRAKQALAAERAATTPRTSLLSKLEAIAAHAEP